MITPKMEQYYEKLREGKRQEYRLLNRQTLVYPELIFLGDSITEWFPINQLLVTTKVWANRGIAASNSQHVLDHLDSLVFGQSLTDLVLLIGTNDIGYDLPAEQTLDNVRAIIEQIKADNPMVTIHLLEILPVNEDKVYQATVDNRTNQAIRALNAAYADLADSLSGVTLVETYEHFLGSDGMLARDLTKDGLHLSEAGYAKLAELVQALL